MFLSIKSAVRLGVAALWLLPAQATSVQLGPSAASPAAILFEGGIQAELAARDDWHPLGAAGRFELVTSVTSVAHYPDLDPMPIGDDYIPSSSLMLLIVQCR